LIRICFLSRRLDRHVRIVAQLAQVERQYGKLPMSAAAISSSAGLSIYKLRMWYALKHCSRQA